MRETRFTFLCDNSERRMIEVLAMRLKRNESDAVRFVIREAVRALESDAQPMTAQPSQQGAQHVNG